MSLLLNCSMDWAATTDAGRLFHRQMVLGKKEYRDAEILWWCLWNCMGWPLVFDVDGTRFGGPDGIAMRPWVMRYSMMTLL